MPLNPQYKDLTKETLQRLDAAERHWLRVRQWIDDVHAFTQPRKVRPQSSHAQTDDGRIDLFTSIGIEVNNDFSSDLLIAFTPEYGRWVKLEAGTAVPPAEEQSIKDSAGALEDSIFREISNSNFYSIVPMAYKDFGTTAGAVFIQDIAPSLPANVQHVPVNQLRLQVGPFGGVDDRFWIRPAYWKDIKALFPESWRELPPDYLKKMEKNPLGPVTVVHGGWRIWDDVTRERWQWINMIEPGSSVRRESYGATASSSRAPSGWLLEPEILDGAGSMPLIVGRWDPDSLSPWGSGPGFNALADLRSLDDVNYNIIDGIGKAVNPVCTYPEDGVLSPRDGVEAGDWLPRRPGPHSDVQVVNEGSRIDVGYFSKEDFELTVRRHYFQDQPMQRGKTPPTLGQWLDEAQRIQKRLGVPAAPLFTEFVAEVWLRFHRIGINRGKYQDIKLKDGTIVHMVPVNPVRRAQKQEDVLLATRLLEIIQQFFPKLAEALVDPETIQTIKEALGDELVKLRDPNEAQLMGLLQNLVAQGAKGGAPAIGNMAQAA